MRKLSIFLFEWKHFVRSPFKLLALLFFMVAAMHGLHTGEQLYSDQTSEIERLEQQNQEARQELIDQHFKTGVMTSEERPWINYSSPFWAIWNSSVYHYKRPSPAVVYGVGQSEQFGFYKEINFWSSPYDADLAEEIANPERLYKGTLDFSFSLLYLLPLLLLILTYDIRSVEAERGMLALIEVQTASERTWRLARISFYFTLILGVLIVLIAYGALLTGLFNQGYGTFFEMILCSSIYLLFWSILYFFILSWSKSVLSTTLQMSALYLLLSFVAPALVHQVLSIKYPANLMTDFIDVREEEEALFAQEEEATLEQLRVLFPEIAQSSLYGDTVKRSNAIRRTMSSLSNELKKNSIRAIEAEFQERNEFIERCFIVSPISFFQNRLNGISNTHFDDYQNYRNEIQALIDKQITTLVSDMWNGVEVGQERFEEYVKLSDQ